MRRATLFRAALSQGTPLGLEAKSYMDRGELVPDDVTVRMLLERISQPDAADGYILDGFPRSLAQAEALDEALTGRNETIDKVLLVDVSEDELVRRLSGVGSAAPARRRTTPSATRQRRRACAT